MKKRRAFTLVELLVVISIIAILAAVLLPAVSRAKTKGQLARCKSNERQMAIALTVFHADMDGYPYRDVPAPMGQVHGWFDELSPYVGNAKWGEGVYRCPAYKWASNAPRSPGEVVVGSYAYNAFGFSPNNASYGQAPGRSLGLAGTGVGRAPEIPRVKDSMVKVPSDMYALGDSAVLFEVNNITHLSGGMAFYPFSAFALTNSAFGRLKEIVQHGTGYNMAFLDGHVEFVLAPNLFSARPIFWRRWNLDHWALGDPF